MTKCECMKGVMTCFVPCEVMMEAQRRRQEIYAPPRGVFVTKVNIDGKVKYREGITDEAHNG